MSFDSLCYYLGSSKTLCASAAVAGVSHLVSGSRLANVVKAGAVLVGVASAVAKLARYITEPPYLTEIKLTDPHYHARDKRLELDPKKVDQKLAKAKIRAKAQMDSEVMGVR